MTQFENIKNMNIEAFSEWLDEHGQFDGSPWMEWFDCKYCSNCEPVMCHYEGSEREFPCAWCELEHKCKFFPGMDEAPGNRDIIKMWLESEAK